jgi:hypothetical protein
MCALCKSLSKLEILDGSLFKQLQSRFLNEMTLTELFKMNTVDIICLLSAIEKVPQATLPQIVMVLENQIQKINDKSISFKDLTILWNQILKIGHFK